MKMRSALAALSVAVALAACTTPGGAPEKTPATKAAVPAGAATSAGDFGGQGGLIAAAKKEGTLNVIGLPAGWVNYGRIIAGFTAKYGIKVVSAQPDASSQEEIDAAERLEGRDTAPDVFDVGQAVALANLDRFAPYQVATWEEIPATFKQADGRAVADYGGYMALGYDAGKVPAVRSLDDLLKPAFKGKVALTGDPTRTNAALNAVRMASIAKGGTASDAAPGVAFFARLKKAGDFVPVDATEQTILSGRTPVVFNWDYLNAAMTAKLPTWKVFVPSGAAVAGYYYQAINKDAAHPAAARLWQEYLYSDEGQNLWLAGGARPVRAEAMVEAGTIDKPAYDKLPAVTGAPVLPTPDDDAAVADYLGKSWAAAIG
jgi:putative spermidine/putrescine transport system substrate-binding protein